jgi:hypothetical protein
MGSKIDMPEGGRTRSRQNKKRSFVNDSTPVPRRRIKSVRFAAPMFNQSWPTNSASCDRFQPFTLSCIG